MLVNARRAQPIGKPDRHFVLLRTPQQHLALPSWRQGTRAFACLFRRVQQSLLKRRGLLEPMSFCRHLHLIQTCFQSGRSAGASSLAGIVCGKNVDDTQIFMGSSGSSISIS
jgi:hypothetical protein